VIRVFTTLAIVSVMLMLITLGIGLAIGDYPALQKRWAELKRAGDQSGLVEFEAERARSATSWLSVHRLAGVGTAVMVLLVNSVAVTYMIGTSRWCREVAETYDLDPALAAEGQTNKRKNFPWAMLAMLSVIVLAGLGAAADPWRNNALRNEFPSEAWILIHYLAALLSIALVVLAFAIQTGYLQKQGALLQRIMAEVQRIRGAQGLE
jgi:hypothetical protein